MFLGESSLIHVNSSLLAAGALAMTASGLDAAGPNAQGRQGRQRFGVGPSGDHQVRGVALCRIVASLEIHPQNDPS